MFILELHGAEALNFRLKVFGIRNCFCKNRIDNLLPPMEIPWQVAESVQFIDIPTSRLKLE